MVRNHILITNMTIKCTLLFPSQPFFLYIFVMIIKNNSLLNLYDLTNFNCWAKFAGVLNKVN